MYRPLKTTKTEPACANKKKLFENDVFSLWWIGRAVPRRRGAKKPSPPRPRNWAQLTVFLKDTSRRKRSYHIAWNGHHFNDTPDTRLLYEREPEVAEAVDDQLFYLSDKIIKS